MPKKIHTLLLLGAILLAIPTQSQAKNNTQQTVTDSSNSIHNTHFQLSINDQKTQASYLRFRLGSISQNNQIPLTYENFYSGYTTIRIDGTDYLYGQGTDTKAPHFDPKNQSHTSTQHIADIEITQTLKLNDTGITCSYQVNNPGEARTIGIRIMTDLMAGNDDKGQIKTDQTILEQEAIFQKETMPQTVEMGAGAKPPLLLLQTKAQTYQSLTIANWQSLYNQRWNYEPQSPTPLTDTALAYTWEETKTAPGEKKEYKVQYETPEQITTTPGKVTTIPETKTPTSNGAAKTGDPSKEPLLWILLCTLTALSTGTLATKRKRRKPK